MTSLEEFFTGVSGFSGWAHRDKILLIGWYFQTHAGQIRFSAGQVREAYDQLALERPANTNTYLTNLCTERPASLFRDKDGYYLARAKREELDSKHGIRRATHELHAVVRNLPAVIPDVSERQFLEEVLICLQHGAARAAIVMGWNLAYDHLCNYIIGKHLGPFNTALAAKWPKAKLIAVRDDFSEIKEFDVIDLARQAGAITADQSKLLKEKLGKRNSAAHPNSMVFTPVDAEAFISELINNVVTLKL